MGEAMILGRMHRSPAFRLGLSSFMLVSLLWQVAAADVLVLRNGGRIEGTLANREVVAGDPAAFSYVSFLLLPADRAPELLSFAVSEVEYIVLDGDEATRVIDFQMHRSFPEPPLRSARTEEMRRRDQRRGLALIVLGLGVGIYAAVHPFEENYQTSSYPGGYARVNTGNTYNTANYVLMGVGAFGIVAGATLLNRDYTRAGQSTSIWAMPRGAGLRKSWNF
jgi:hypothetical protein